MTNLDDCRRDLRILVDTTRHLLALRPVKDLTRVGRYRREVDLPACSKERICEHTP